MARTALIAVAVVGGTGVLWLALRSAPPQTGDPGAPAPALARAAPETASAETGSPTGASAQPEALERYHEHDLFVDEVREFFDSASGLPEEERESRAAALRERIEEQERGGALVPQEALMLRLGLLRVTIDDPAVLEHESRALAESYREAQAARAPAPPDPRFDAYQEREAEIVREVLALDEIPGGLTRNEYLRRRLRELRSEVYSGATPEPERR